LLHFKTSVQEVGEFVNKREHQQTIWMWNYIRDHIMDLFRKHASVKEQIRNVESKVVAGEVTPGQGADILIRKFVKDL